MEIDYEEIERVPLGLDIYGRGPVDDDDAVEFVCMGCGQAWYCETELHIKRMKEQYG